MSLQSDLTNSLQSIPWFLELTQEQFQKLVKIAHFCELKPGDVLFTEGDQMDNLYLLLDGQVNIETFVPSKGNLRVYQAEPLDIIGWDSLTPVVRQRTAGARAQVYSQLISFDREALRELCEQDHDLGFVIMRRLSNDAARHLLTTRLHLFDIIVQRTSFQHSQE
jgi:CRP/FNR family transcriptional regulator, cyclic AMP receptor protein